MLLLILFPQSLSSTVTLEHSPLPPGVHVSYESQCGGHGKKDGEAGDRGQSNHVRINQMVRPVKTGRRKWAWEWESEAGMTKMADRHREQCKNIG